MVSTGAILFLSQTIPTSLSLRHLLFNLFRYINQAKSVEYPINVGHTPDIPQRLGSVYYLSDFTDIVIHQQHGTPSKALAALSPVDPQLLGKGHGTGGGVVDLAVRVVGQVDFQRFSSQGFFFSATTAR